MHYIKKTMISILPLKIGHQCPMFNFEFAASTNSPSIETPASMPDYETCILSLFFNFRFQTSYQGILIT